MWPISESTASQSPCTSNCCGCVNVTITTGLVDTYSTPTLLRLVASHQIEAAHFVTHHFKLHEMIEAYDVFARAAEPRYQVVLAR